MHHLSPHVAEAQELAAQLGDLVAAPGRAGELPERRPETLGIAAEGQHDPRRRIGRDHLDRTQGGELGGLPGEGAGGVLRRPGVGQRAFEVDQEVPGIGRPALRPGHVARRAHHPPGLGRRVDAEDPHRPSVLQDLEVLGPEPLDRPPLLVPDVDHELDGGDVEAFCEGAGRLFLGGLLAGGRES